MEPLLTKPLCLLSHLGHPSEDATQDSGSGESGQPVLATLSSCGCSFVLFLPWDPFIFLSPDTSKLLAVRMAVYFCLLRVCRGYHRTEVVGFDSLPKTLVGLGGHFCLTFTFSQILIFRQLFFTPVTVWLWYFFLLFSNFYVTATVITMPSLPPHYKYVFLTKMPLINLAYIFLISHNMLIITIKEINT